jgi:hypothetical protein
MSNAFGRRRFVAAVASVAGLAGNRASAAQAGVSNKPVGAGQFDVQWLDQMKGKHKQLYDLGSQDLSRDAAVLRYARNFLDTFRDVYRLEFPSINTAVGISGPAFAINASDQLWAKYKLGERGKIVDPSTKQPSTRNIFLENGDIGIRALQGRGTVFWQCNVALGIVAGQLATEFHLAVDDVRADLIAGLNPGVRLMPSHVMALALAQEHGFTYMKP